MITISFAIAAGFYFWLGPIGMILLVRQHIRKVTLSIVCISLVSWCVTALLTYCVHHWAPDVLPDKVLKVSYIFGWAYLFVTAIPSVTMYGIAMCFTRSSGMRLVTGLALATIPYVLILYLWLQRMVMR